MSLDQLGDGLSAAEKMELAQRRSEVGELDRQPPTSA